MKDLIKRIVEALVDHPEQVEVIEVVGSATTIIELKVAKGDIGLVIGKQGHNVEAMRAILETAGKKLGKRVVFEIIRNS